MTTLFIAYQLAAFVIGAVLGSNVAVCALRIPEDMSPVDPPSHCPTCLTPIAWTDNVPILSWLLLRGRCRHCGAVISPAYPLLELLGGLVGWLLFQRFVPSLAALEPANVVAWGVYMAFAWALMVVAYTDLRAQIIPEIASIYAVPFGVFGAVLLEFLVYDGWLAIGWQQSVLGALVGGGLFALLYYLWLWVFGYLGVGWGDVRLVAMIGAFLGLVPGTWVVLMFGSLLGAGIGFISMMVTGRNAYFPFGPSICTAALFYVLFGDAFIQAFLPTMRGFI